MECSQSAHGNICCQKRQHHRRLWQPWDQRSRNKGAVTPAEEGAVLRNIAIKQYSGVMSLETVGWSTTSGVC